MLTQERLKELLDYDPATGRFTRKVRTSNRINVGDEAGTTHDKHGYIGVDFHKNSGKFRSRIKVDGKTKCLGHFDTAEKASEAYLAAKAKLHEFSTEVPR